MPTDPFVANHLDDAPRHRQNLPAGVAYPPARRAEPGRRPGEVGVDRAPGALLGTPGPNVGYARTLAERAKGSLRLAAGERVHDVVAVIAEIAMKRAGEFGRAPVKADLDIAIALLGYDGSADPDWAVRRSRLVHDADHHYQHRRALVDAVPAELLRRPPAEIAPRIAGWRDSTAQASVTH